MRILQKQSDIKNAQYRFASAFEVRNPQLINATLGYQGGSYHTKVMWFRELDMWAYFGLPPNEKSPGERYWNVFGTGKPSGNASIVCEINPPINGINRMAAGAFALTADGEIVLLHRGLFNARGKIKKEFVSKYYQGKWVRVSDGDKTSSLIYISQLGSPIFCETVRDFVVEVQRIKKLARK